MNDPVYVEILNANRDFFEYLSINSGTVVKTTRQAGWVLDNLDIRVRHTFIRKYFNLFFKLKFYYIFSVIAKFF